MSVLYWGEDSRRLRPWGGLKLFGGQGFVFCAERVKSLLRS
jgi:hypothetical protein